MKPGPYVNADNDEFYFPVHDWAYNEARSEVASHVEGTHGPWTRTRFDGKRVIQIHDHDDWEEIMEDNCPQPMCWTFVIYEGTYRR